MDDKATTSLLKFLRCNQCIYIWNTSHPIDIELERDWDEEKSYERTVSINNYLLF